jgi:hypothetical protein
MIKIPLTRGLEAEVDDEDAYLASRKWLANPRSDGRFYARCSGVGKLYLHQVVLGLVQGCGVEVDHIDGEGLNCKRNNLRITTHLQNGKNITKRKIGKSGFKGVVFRGRAGAAIKLFGEFANLNFKPTTPPCVIVG